MYKTYGAALMACATMAKKMGEVCFVVDDWEFDQYVVVDGDALDFAMSIGDVAQKDIVWSSDEGEK